MRYMISLLAYLVAFLLTPATLSHAALWTITLSGLARTPPGTLSGFTFGQQIAAYTWDPTQLFWVEPSSLVEGPVTGTYTGLFNGVESGPGYRLRAFSFPGTVPHLELIKDAVFNPGPLTASFFTNPTPISLELNESQLWHNGIEYAWGPTFGSLTPVTLTVAQGSIAPIPEPGTAALFTSSLLGFLYLRRRSRA